MMKQYIFSALCLVSGAFWIFVEYGITLDDEADAVRNGGFGSTTQ